MILDQLAEMSQLFARKVLPVDVRPPSPDIDAIEAGLGDKRDDILNLVKE
jgi:hypothetical protein